MSIIRFNIEIVDEQNKFIYLDGDVTLADVLGALMEIVPTEESVSDFIIKNETVDSSNWKLIKIKNNNIHQESSTFCRPYRMSRYAESSPLVEIHEDFTSYEVTFNVGKYKIEYANGRS